MPTYFRGDHRDVVPSGHLSVQGLQGGDAAVHRVDVEQPLQVCVTVDGISAAQQTARYKYITSRSPAASFDGVPVFPSASESVRLPVCKSVALPCCVSVRESVRTCPSESLHVFLSTLLYVCKRVCMSVCKSVRLSLRIAVCL